jgi:hypothetical protein
VQPRAAPVKAGINLSNCNFGLSLWSRMECVYQGKEVRKGPIGNIRRAIPLLSERIRSVAGTVRRLGAVVLGPREHDLLQLKFFRLVERELSASPTTHAHEKDRIPVIGPL